MMMIKLQNLKTLLLFILIISAWSCNREKAPDITDFESDINIRRFEKTLFAADPASPEATVNQLKNEYPSFFPLYNHAIIEIGSSENPAYNDMLSQFLGNFSVYKAYKASEPLFADLSGLEAELEKSFAYYRYYFPEKRVPEIVTYIGGFNQSTVTAENLLGIGLDKYLGSDHEIYRMMNPPYPDYFLYRMRPEFIAADCMKGWLYSEFPYNDSTNNLVNNIIYEGMTAYILEKTMPEANDTLLFGFSPKQLEFCEENEVQMWTYLIENKMLFESNGFIIRQFVGEAPFTKGFSPESPGKAVQWLGRQIIKSYVKKNKIAPDELMHRTDYLNILNNSGYNP